MYRDADDDSEISESSPAIYDMKIIGSIIILFAIGLMAFLSTYTYAVVGSNIYIQSTLVSTCILFMVGLLKLLSEWINHCIGKERAENPNYLFKIEFICWVLYFTTFGSIGALSLFGYHHPLVALGVGDFFYLFFTWFCGALFVLGCLKLILDYLIECMTSAIPLRKDREHRRQLCEDIINWFLLFIILGYLAFVSWKNSEALDASGGHYFANFGLKLLGDFFGVLVFVGLVAISCGLAGSRITWNDDENQPTWRMRRILLCRLRKASTQGLGVSITPLQIYSNRPFPRRTRRIPRRTKKTKRLPVVTETVDMTEKSVPTNQEEGQVVGISYKKLEEKTLGGSTITVPVTVHQPPKCQPDEGVVNIEPPSSTSEGLLGANVDPQPGTSQSKEEEQSPSASQPGRKQPQSEQQTSEGLTRAQKMIQKLKKKDNRVKPTDNPPQPQRRR